MTTIYNWNEVVTLTTGLDTTADFVFVYDATDGQTKKAAVGALQTVTTQTTASAAGTLTGAGGVALLGTSTAVFLSAPAAVGVFKYIINHSSSTVALSITASGSSFNTGLSAYTTPGGGSLVLYGISTLKWGIVSHFQTGADTSTSVFLS